jgi:hypothetical protein
MTCPPLDTTGSLIFLKQLPSNGVEITTTLQNTSTPTSSRRIRQTITSTSGYSIKVVPINMGTSPSVDFYISYTTTKPTATKSDDNFNYPTDGTYKLKQIPNGQWYLYIIAVNRKNTTADFSLVLVTPTFDAATIPSGGDPTQLPFSWSLEIIVVISCAGAFLLLSSLIVFGSCICMCVTLCSKNKKQAERELLKRKQQNQRKKKQMSEQEHQRARRNEYMRKQNESPKKVQVKNQHARTSSTSTTPAEDIEMALMPTGRVPMSPVSPASTPGTPVSPKSGGKQRSPKTKSAHTIVQPFVGSPTVDMIGSHNSPELFSSHPRKSK